jgi:hypothetical protein
LHGICCVACRLLFAVCCMKSGACCMLRIARCMSFAAYCPLHGAWCLDVVCCTLRGVGCIFAVCCMPSVVCCTGLLHVAPLRFVAARSPSHVARPPMPVPRSHVACALPVACPTSSLVRCTLRAATRLLPAACFTFSVAWFLSSVACPIFHVGCRMSSSCRVTQRRRTRIVQALAIEASVAGEAKR